MNNYDGIEDALQVETDIVPTDKPLRRATWLRYQLRRRINSKKIMNTPEGTFIRLLKKVKKRLMGSLEQLQESEQPRAFEVAGQLIKHVGDVADKLVDLQKKVNEIENPKKGKEVNTTNNTMFVGSTADLAKFLKQQKE